VLANISPPLYKLIDLLSDAVPGLYYAAQLTKTKKPEDSDFQFVEKIIKEKTIKNEKFYYVKFLFFPGSISQLHEG